MIGAFARKDRDLKSFALEALRIGCSPHAFRLVLQPGVNALLVDHMKGSGRLALVGFEECLELGHGRALARPPPVRKSLDRRG